MKKILVFSDTHVGSTVGLWPPGMIAQEGNPLPQSKFQQWLWECWKDMQDWLKKQVSKKDELTIVFNGDVIEGSHHRTVQIMSPNVDDQLTAALEIFQPLVNKAKRHYMIKGTECHTKGAEMILGKVTGAVKDEATKQHAFDHLKLDVDGCVCSFAHHITATSRPYLEASAHSIHMGVEIMEAARNGHAIPNVIARAHRHRHGVWRDGNCMSLVTGAWQALTRHGYKVVPAAVPNPSVILLEFHPGKKLPHAEELVFVPEETKPDKI